MAQLILRSPFDSNKDKVESAWEGSAAACLPTALLYFKEAALERARRLVNGDIPNAPAVIVDNARHLLAKQPSEFAYTIIVNADNSYGIYIDEGPDRYDLVD